MSGVRQFATEALVPAEWEVGDVLLDLYEVTGILGQGGMGKVYRVHHRGWGLDLAVKSPHPEFMETDEGRQSFVREAETWVNLGLHPQTVSCYYIRTLGTIPRVFAEYVEGGSLEDWIRDRLYDGSSLEILARLLDIAIQIAWGLHHAHEAGLIHQDVKPANVMLTLNGTAKVTDFGLAKARFNPQSAEPFQAWGAPRERAVSIVIPGSGVCTPEYASPEQIEGQPLSRRTDIWSWAVTVLEMASGQRPMLGPMADLVLQDYRERLKAGRPAHGRHPGVPPLPEAVRDLLGACLADSPEDRPRTLLECAISLCGAYREATGQPHPRVHPGDDDIQADGLNNRAVSLLDLGYVQEAEKLLERALGTDAHHLCATHNLGLLQWRTGRLAEAAMLQRMSKARAFHLPTWEDPFLLGCVHVEAGHLDSARAMLEQAARATNDSGVQRTIQEILRSLAAGTTSPAPPALVRPRRSEEVLEARMRFSALIHEARTALAGQDWRAAVTAVSLARALPGYDQSPECLALWEDLYPHAMRGSLRGTVSDSTLKGHQAAVSALAMVPDGARAVSLSSQGDLLVWNLTSGRSRLRMAADGGSPGIAITPDARLAVTATGSHLCVWDLARGDCVRRRLSSAERPITGLALSSDGRQVAAVSQDGAVHLGWLANGEGLEDPVLCSGGKPQAIALSADGHLLALAGESGRLEIWKTRDLVHSFQGSGPVRCVRMTPDGRTAITAGHDGTLQVWDIAAGRNGPLLQGHRGRVQGLALTPDGRIAVSSGEDRTVRIWDVLGGGCMRILETDTADIGAVEITVDARLVLSGDTDGNLRLWNLDWDLVAHDAADWDEGAETCLQTFLAVRPEPGAWTETDFRSLLRELSYWGYGWLRPEGVRERLRRR